MDRWQDLKIQGIASIEKVAAEFDISELDKTPYAKFKVKIYESNEGKFTGYTNLRVKDGTGDASGGVGFGATVAEALGDTILYFLKLPSTKDIWGEEDFEYSDACEC